MSAIFQGGIPLPCDAPFGRKRRVSLELPGGGLNRRERLRPASGYRSPAPGVKILTGFFMARPRAARPPPVRDILLAGREIGRDHRRDLGTSPGDRQPAGGSLGSSLVVAEARKREVTGKRAS